MTLNEAEINYLGDVQRLALNPGDTVVLTVSQYISQENAERLKAMLKKVLGEDYRYLVIDSNIKIGVLGQEQEVKIEALGQDIAA